MGWCSAVAYPSSGSNRATRQILYHCNQHKPLQHHTGCRREIHCPKINLGLEVQRTKQTTSYVCTPVQLYHWGKRWRKEMPQHISPVACMPIWQSKTLDTSFINWCVLMLFKTIYIHVLFTTNNIFIQQSYHFDPKEQLPYRGTSNKVLNWRLGCISVLLT